MSTHPFRVVVLSGSDSQSTAATLSRLVDLASVKIVALIHDRAVFTLKYRLKRFWRRVRLEGGSYLALRLLSYALGILKPRMTRRFDPEPIRRRIFADEIRSVTDFCTLRQIPRIEVDSLNGAEAQSRLKAVAPDLGVVIGTRVLKRETFSIPRLGSINIHKGKVPEYRGQPPAFWELYNGEKEAGVTIHFVDDGLDSGAIVVEGSCSIESGETEHSLKLRLDELGASLLREAVEAIASGRLTTRPQPSRPGRLYTTPTRREQAALDRRLGTQPESAIKRTLKHAFYTSMLFCGPVALRNTWLSLKRQSRFTLLLYHRVNDYSRDNLTTSIGRFIEHLALLKRRYPVVSLSEALEAARSGRFLGPNVIAITFDDGYADNHEIAAPILKHFGLPATFFVTAGLVGTARTFEHDSRSPYRFSNLTWEQVRALAADFEVGSHGWSHLNLGRSTFEDARREVRESLARLERELERPVRSFAYPFGGRDDITPWVIEEIVGAGCEAVASAYGGTNLRDLDPLNIRRAGVHEAIDPLALRALVEGVSLGALKERVTAIWPVPVAVKAPEASGAGVMGREAI